MLYFSLSQSVKAACTTDEAKTTHATMIIWQSKMLYFSTQLTKKYSTSMIMWQSMPTSRDVLVSTRDKKCCKEFSIWSFQKCRELVYLHRSVILYKFSVHKLLDSMNLQFFLQCLFQTIMVRGRFLSDMNELLRIIVHVPFQPFATHPAGEKGGDDCVCVYSWQLP